MALQIYAVCLIKEQLSRMIYGTYTIADFELWKGYKKPV